MTTPSSAQLRALVAGLAAATLTLVGLVAALTTPATALSPIRHCSVQERTNAWSGGFVSELTIMMYVPVSEWTVEWTNSPTQRVTNTWNAQVSGDNGVYQFRNVAWNGNVAAQGTFSFGFQGTSSGAWTRPTNITVNGIYCIQYMPEFPSLTPTPTPTTPKAEPTMPTPTPEPTPSATPTPTPTPTTDPGGCAGAFCDGFESQPGTAPAAPWTVVHPDCSGTGTASIDSAVARTGTRSLRVNGAVGYCNHVFVQASGAVFGTGPTYVRFWVRHTTALPTSHVTFVALKDADDGNKDLRMGGQNGALQWNRSSDDATLPEQSPSGVALSTPLPTGQWSCIEALVEPAGRLTTWLDGTLVTGLVADGTPTHDIDSQWHNKAWAPRLVDLKMGWESYGDGADTLWYDDVVVGSARTGC